MDDLVERIRALCKERGTSITKVEEKLGYANGKAYHEAVKAAGVRDLPPYSCRHTTATALALGNIAPSVIQQVMRHTKFSTTQRYIHPDTKAARTAVNTIGGVEKESKN